METSSLRTLKIMPRNLNDIVRSWIRLQEKQYERDFEKMCEQKKK